MCLDDVDVVRRPCDSRDGGIREALLYFLGFSDAVTMM